MGKKNENPTRETGFGNLIKKNFNEYVVCGGTVSKTSTPPAQVTFTSKIFAIDSLGNTKWSWESPESTQETGLGRLFKTDQGNWAYSTIKCTYNTQYAEYQCQPKFVIRDTNFKIISDVAFGARESPRNGFYHVTQLSDGGWLCVGTRSVRYPIAPYAAPAFFNSVSGWMVKVSPQGDSLWGRIDTAYWNSEYGSYNELRSAIELPSGSIIACGETRTLDTLLGLKSWGWLLKVDKNGCLTMLDCATSGTAPVPSLVSGLNVFPNPARDAVTFTYLLPEGTSSTALRVFDVNGRAVFQKDGLPSAGAYGWETLGNPSGIYFYQLLVEGAIRERGKLVIRK